MFEVEQKFRVDGFAEIETHLARLGAEIENPIEQVDTYFAHPQRDFAATDEALRIRQVGDENFVTYKGPKIDSQTKTRREIELPFASGELFCRTTARTVTGTFIHGSCRRAKDKTPRGRTLGRLAIRYRAGRSRSSRHVRGTGSHRRRITTRRRPLAAAWPRR